MCWVEGYIINRKLYVIGESVLRNSNTIEMCEHIKNKYKLKKNSQGKYNVTVYADSSANSNATNATLTDLQIMRQFGVNVKAKNANPRQRERVKTVNSALKPMFGDPVCYINPVNCPELVKDMIKVEALGDGRLNKDHEKQGEARVHISDGLGYLIDYEFPIKTNVRVMQH